MQADAHFVPTLIEVGRRTANIAFMILSEKLGASEPASEVEVTLLPGKSFRLTGPEAREWCEKLSRLIPGTAGVEREDTRTTVIRRVVPGVDVERE